MNVVNSNPGLVNAEVRIAQGVPRGVIIDGVALPNAVTADVSFSPDNIPVLTVTFYLRSLQAGPREESNGS